MRKRTAGNTSSRSIGSITWTSRFISISRQQKQPRNGRRLPKPRLSPKSNSPAGHGRAIRLIRTGNVMPIKNHDKSRIADLENGSLWPIWQGDLALTLNWLPTTDLRVSEISDEFCSHALIDQADGSRVVARGRAM